MKIVFLFVFLSGISYSLAAMQTDSLLVALNKAIQNKHAYESQKSARLKYYHDQLNSKKGKNAEDQFEVLAKLSDEYKTFVYDSAFTYIKRL
jgi:hypothetical protein